MKLRKQSKIWTITTPEEAAIITKSLYKEKTVRELYFRRMRCLIKLDFSAIAFWNEVETLVKTCPDVDLEFNQVPFG